MKGWKLVSPNKLDEVELNEVYEGVSKCKVKITKSLLSFSDLLRYNGEIETEQVVLGSAGIGVIVENDANLFGLEKGKRVFIEPNQKCQQCYNCKSGESNCSNLQIAGEDYDGFLRDFCLSSSDKLFLLPDSVSDIDALFISHVSNALAIIDKLRVQKGDYVAILGGNNFSIILAQLLIYYQAVPIMLTIEDQSYTAAKESGVYYVLDKDDNWQREVSIITGGRMAEKVVYITDSYIPSAKAFQLASFNAGVVFTGTSSGKPVQFNQAVKKQLNILCVNDASGYTASSINLLANKAISLAYVTINKGNYRDVPEILKTLNASYENDQLISETIIEMI
ncbi:MAG: zinc-binding dehydrogenase [Clostridia bacterium]|nr:zinc-binding dehydrogenase [Clostridia bacterium]